MSVSEINNLRDRRKELRARFFPSQAPLRLVPTEPLAKPLPPKPDAPVVKHIKIAPENEPMDFEEFARKMRQGDFPRSEANYRRLIQKIAEEYGFTYDDIVGRARPAKLVEARFHVCWYLTQKMKCSENGVGRMLNKDHTTVRHAITRWQERVDAEFIAKRDAK